MQMLKIHSAMWNMSKVAFRTILTSKEANIFWKASSYTAATPQHHTPLTPPAAAEPPNSANVDKTMHDV